MVGLGTREVEQILQERSWNRQNLVSLLSMQDPAAIDTLRAAAEQTVLSHCGAGVALRGLIEFSNICVSDCHYCGIRKRNHHVERYTLTDQEVVDAARWCAKRGYGSIVLQSGERRDRRFIDRLVNNIRRIKQATCSAQQPDGVGITLCVGEQRQEDYQQLYEAGAHRYLLRIETTSPALFASLHPPEQSFSGRLACLHGLRDAGFIVGTGVMIGIPGQTLAQLADDLLFFQSFDIDMIGMGPYIPHAAAVMPDVPVVAVSTRLDLAFKMIALVRLMLPDVNVAATTALQALDPVGRERGLRFGANVIMPQVTPLHVRKQYALYDGKPCLEDSAGQCASCLENRIASVGRFIHYHRWGDSLRFSHRHQLPIDPALLAPPSTRLPPVSGRRVIALQVRQD